MLRIVRLADADRARVLARLHQRAARVPVEVEASARRILDDVRARGDAAVRDATLRFEGRTVEELEIPRARWHAEADRTSPEIRAILERAHARIARFHEAEKRGLAGAAFVLDEDPQATLRLSVRALSRVGLYAPGGTARYPSTVLMTSVPAQVAGVGELHLVTPGPSPETLHAARLGGVDHVYAVGGAQAIGALAYGTESVPRVDKIVGPGNAYVAAAKRLVFGEVGIDQVAGPSEVLIIADAEASPALVAADLLAQAEHDADVYAVLCTPSLALAEAVAAEVESQLATLPRAALARRAIDDNGAAVIVASLVEAEAFADKFAPEHLELYYRGASEADAAEIYRTAGAIFVGGSTPEAVGDYYAGPNHVLPTGGAARYGSPLGVHDFLKRTSVICYSAAALSAQAEDIVRFAAVEGLEAHGRAVTARVDAAATRKTPGGA